MTAGLQASGQITMGQISVEILRSSTAQTSLGDTDVRTLFGVASGQISFSNGYSKRWVTPGSSTITASTTFSVPRYATITVQVYGGGGGGGGGGGNDSWAYGYNGGCGSAGGTSTFSSSTACNAYGGGAGCPGAGGAAGGQDGPAGSTLTTGGGSPGGAGGGGNNGYSSGGTGGAGGYVAKTWAYTDSGAPAWFGSIGVTVGGAGGGGGGGENAPGGANGTAGKVIITWT